MNQIVSLKEFYIHRLRLPTWLLASVILCLLGGTHFVFNAELIPVSFIFLVALRFIDEWGSLNYDHKHKGRVKCSLDLRRPLLFSGLIYLLLTISASIAQGFAVDKAIGLTIFSLLSVLAYIGLRDSKLVSLVSIFKYPFIIWLLSPRPTVNQYLYALIIFLGMCIFEAKSEKLFMFKHRGKL